jgi:uncharacterized protein (TIGR03118 family)
MQRCRIACTVCLGFALMFISSAAWAQYRLSNLDSNQVGTAIHTDPLLANGWGLVHAPGSPWWVSDNDSGWSTLYNNKGIQVSALKVLIPTAGENGPGSPTGIVWSASTSNEFEVGGGPWPSVFLFATLDGTISGWAPAASFNNAFVAPLNPAPTGAVFTGLAITNKPSGNFLYAADTVNGAVDVYDGNFNLVTTATANFAAEIASAIPAGFTPYGIRDINGEVYVTFASNTGGSGGFVEKFKEDGTPVTPGHPLLSGGPLAQPWGIAAASRNFGQFSNTLLISNNMNSGTINAFDAVTGQLVGTLRDKSGKAIEIDLLWGIDFGDGLKGTANGGTNEMFFTAGPSNYLAGRFGVIVPD